jgi:hypothetical protein
MMTSQIKADISLNMIAA